MTRIAQVGLGQWGKNLARNFDRARRARLALRCRGRASGRGCAVVSLRRVTSSFDDVLADESVEAVVVATPVPTHYELARRALEAGKHVFVEKPPAMRGAEMEELCELAEERGLVLMPGHLLLYHPGVQKLKEIVDSGELGDVLYVYGNRQNLGTIQDERERALVARGARPLRAALPDRRGAERGAGARPRVPEPRRRGRRLLLPALSIREDRAHASVLAGSAQDPAHHGRRQRARWRCSTTWSPNGRSRCTTRRRDRDDYDGAPHGRHPQPDGRSAEPLRRECEHFLSLVAGEGDPLQGRARRNPRRPRSRQLQASLETVTA